MVKNKTKRDEFKKFFFEGIMPDSYHEEELDHFELQNKYDPLAEDRSGWLNLTPKEMDQINHRKGQQTNFNDD